MVKDSALVLCVICNAAEARRHGPECRQCYKRNKQRAYRHHEDEVPDEIRQVSLDRHMFEVDRLAYREWLNDE